MEDEKYCEKRAAEAYRQAEAEPLVNARMKLIAAAEAWQGMARRKKRVKEASNTDAGAKD